MDLLGAKEEEGAGLWSGEEEKFMFDRTVSRLHEMQTEKYLRSKHNPQR